MMNIYEIYEYMHEYFICFQSATEFSPDSEKISSDTKNLKTEESSLRQENVELKVRFLFHLHLY